MGKNHLDGGDGWAERGEGRMKAIVWTAVLLIAVFVGIKIIPAYVNEYQLQDKMQEEARYATVNRRSDDDLRNIIYSKIQDLDIPAKRENIKIEQSSRAVKITVEYTVPVDFIVYKTELHFAPSTENRSIL